MNIHILLFVAGVFVMSCANIFHSSNNCDTSLKLWSHIFNKINSIEVILTYDNEFHDKFLHFIQKLRDELPLVNSYEAVIRDESFLLLTLRSRVKVSEAFLTDAIYGDIMQNKNVLKWTHKVWAFTEIQHSDLTSAYHVTITKITLDMTNTKIIITIDKSMITQGYDANKIVNLNHPHGVFPTPDFMLNIECVPRSLTQVEIEMINSTLRTLINYYFE